MTGPRSADRPVRILTRLAAEGVSRDGPFLRGQVLSYRWRQTDEEWQSIELPIPLETTQPRFGGLRWWGRCPLAVSGVACRRRVAKLYLPPGERYFGCRVCHG